MKLKIYTILLLIAAVLTTAFIFHNSVNISEVSYAQSNTVAEAIRPIFNADKSIPEISFDALVRKAAHVIEFGILGCGLMGLTLILASVKGRRAFAYICTPLFFSMLVAVVDEYIQTFTGRTSAIKDVLIDFTGSIAGIILISMIYAFIKMTKRRHS